MIPLFKKTLKTQPIIITKLQHYFSGFLNINIDKISRFEEALESFDQAIQKNPENPDYYYNKGTFNSAFYNSYYFIFVNKFHIIITKMNKFEEALKYYDSAIQKNPENSDYYYNKGSFKSAYLSSQYFIFIKILQIIITKMNRFEEALKYFDQAIQKNPENSDYQQNKAITLFCKNLYRIIAKMNRFVEAIEYYDSAIQKQNSYFHSKI